MGYFKDFIKGFSWIGSLRGLTRIITFVKLAALARLLTPEDFGYFGIAALILALLEILTETGINVFLLQQRENWEKYISTAWVISIGRGILIGLMIFIFTPSIANYFNGQNVINLLYLTCLIPIIRGFINPSNIRFQKYLEFNREFYYRLFLILVEFCAALAFAYTSRRAESLIYAMIISSFVEVVVSFLFISPRPKIKFIRDYSKEIIHQGKWITGYSIFSYILTQGDDIAVGKLLGASSLGIYQNAYKISTLPMLEAHDVILKVTFPIYTNLQKDSFRIRQAIKNQILLTLVISLIIGLVLFLFSESIVSIILGPAWLPAAPIIKILAFLGTIRGISYAFNSLFLALKKQRYVTYITFVSVVVLLVTILPFINAFGMVGAAAAELLSSAFALPVAIYYMVKTFRKL